MNESFGTPFGSSQRNAGISDPITLRFHGNSASVSGVRSDKNPTAAGLLFATRNGRPHTTNKVNEYRLHPLLKKLGIPPCSMNGFRHTLASLLVSMGASPAVAQRQLRHSDPMTTLRNYTHIVGAEQREAVERIAGILRPTAAPSKTEVQWTQ